jgi:hypothetical protein
MIFFAPRWGPHAARRKRKFGISERQIAFTWLYGETHQERDGCWRLIGEEVTLVLDPLQLFIITLFPNRYKDRFIARNARFRRADGNVRLEWLDGTYAEDYLQALSAHHKFSYVFGSHKKSTKGDSDFSDLAKAFDAASSSPNINS